MMRKLTVLLLSGTICLLGAIPVLANTGVTVQNIRQKLQVTDGAVIGTYSKVNRNPWNSIDIDSVKKLLKEARKSQ